MRQNAYTPIQQVRDRQPIRATCFHPSGEAYVVGTNSKALKICKYPSPEEIQELMRDDEGDLLVDGIIDKPKILFTCLHIHCASVYCATFDQSGQLLATGSNDQVVHIIKYDSERHAPGGSEYKLSMHTGTVRDVCFLSTSLNHDLQSPPNPSSSAMLLSAGCGQFEINLTDCNVMRPKQSFKGHTATVMSLSSCRESSSMFASGSLDGTIKIWDIRCSTPVLTASNKSSSTSHGFLNPDGDNGQTRIIGSGHDDIDNSLLHLEHKTDQENLNPTERQPNHTTTPHNRRQLVDTTARPPVEGIPVGAVRLDPTGRLLASGHQDGSCMLYDVRADKVTQVFRPHNGEIRTLNFSPKSYYLLTGSYDRKIRLTDIQGHLTNPLPSVEVIEQDDKIVQTAWHPVDYNFVSTCADGSATLWTIADFDEWRRDSMVTEIRPNASLHN